MNIAMPPDGGDSRKPAKSFEDLLKELKPKLEKVPKEMRVPALPPTEDAATEVQEYIREKLGLPVVDAVPNWIARRQLEVPADDS